MTVSTFRELTTDEHALLDRLLRDAFPGKPEIEHQLRTAQVRQIDPEGSLELRVANATAAGVVHRIPVEAMYKDSDGVPVHILFHVVNGKASELEIFKSDGSEIHRRPRPNDLEVTYATDARQIGHSDESLSLAEQRVPSNMSDSLIDRSACTALVLTCSDFRFKSAERTFAEASGLTDDYDLIARPGAARLIVAPRSPAMRDTLLDEVRLLWSVHHFPRILLVNHVSCRAYDDIATSENELALHAEHLQRAAAILAEGYADVRVETYLVDRAADGIAVRPIA